MEHGGWRHCGCTALQGCREPKKRRELRNCVTLQWENRLVAACSLGRPSFSRPQTLLPPANNTVRKHSAVEKGGTNRTTARRPTGTAA